MSIKERLSFARENLQKIYRTGNLYSKAEYERAVVSQLKIIRSLVKLV